MKAAVRRVLLLSALMSPAAAYALGLGDIHLHSALNQPFDAEIDLVSATQEDLSALRAALASSDTFARYGVDRPAYLGDFTFRVEKGAGGKDILRITSPKPVTEPFVTLLVEASWPRGRLLREYTVLLDPPVYAPAPGPAGEAPVVTPRASSTPGRAAPSETPSQAGTTTGTARRSSIAAAPGSTYRVQPNDTLWKIAAAANPGSRADVDRAMVAIFQKNPQAFDGNINVLRAGAELSIPQASEISAISASAASAEVSRQYRMWREASAAGTSGAESGRLRLVTPEQGGAAPSTATAATEQPSSTGGAAGTADAQARVKQLESELAEARRLLEVRNAELATLQGQAPQAAAPAAAAPAPAAATPAPEAGPPAAAGEAPTAQEPAAAAPEATPPAVQPPKATPPKKQPPAKPPVEKGPSLLDRLMEFWWVFAALVVAALGALLFKRLRSDRGGSVEDLEEALARPTGDLRSRATAGSRASAREADIVVEEKRPVESAASLAAVAATAATRAPEATRKPVSIEDTLSGEGPATVESGDPLAEADFHMAYGLYDQAADLVQLALKREPQRRDLRLKLLEIFFVWGNRDRFMQLAREMNATRGEAQPGEWDKVLIMGKQIAPEDPMFAGAAAHASVDDLDMELHGSDAPLDMDLGEGALSLPDVDLTGTGPAGMETGLDFIIDEPDRGGSRSASSQAPTIETAALAPTIETQRIGRTNEDTEEVPIESLGLDVDSLDGLDDLDKAEDFLPPGRKATAGDKSPRPGMASDDEVDADLLTSTSIMSLPEGAALGSLDEPEPGIVDLTEGMEATGEMPTIETAARAGTPTIARVDFSLGEEAATMSEVGTKLDLARAYIDMGDPEGARSILEEVLHEGSAAQKQEAERLIASLP